MMAENQVTANQSSETSAKKGNMLYLSSSPHFSRKSSTQKIMATVLIALLPEVVAGVVFFGISALATVFVSVASCVIFELLFQRLTGQTVRISNLSACVSGVMMALVIPPTVPLWMVVLGALIAMVVAKGLFGGIGQNVFNPALTGRAVLFISFPSVLGSNWHNTRFMTDAISSPTPLSLISQNKVNFDSVTLWNYFIGNKSGCIGETSILLILLSFLFLLFTRIIDWRAPLSFVLTVFIGTFFAHISGGFVEGAQYAVLSLLTGGVAFGACFMVTDYATAPVTKPGRLVFGFGCGLITFLIRECGGYPEGVMFSILIMNAIAPFLNNITPRMYGYGKKGM